MMDFSDRVSEALPAATAVVVRQSGSGREVLLLKRSDQLKHMPGLWVFPGGKVEPTDAGEGELEQARHGAVSCLLYTSPSPRDYAASRMPSSA